MATTIKAIVVMSELKQDDTYNIKIRVTHNRATRLIPTNIYAKKTDIKKDGSFKPTRLQDRSNELVIQARVVVENLGFKADSMSIGDIVDKIRLGLSGELKSNKKFSLDICTYTLDYAQHLPYGTSHMYTSVVSAIRRFSGRDIHDESASLDVNDINIDWVNEFANFINGTKVINKSTPVKRATHLYIKCLKAMFNRAKDKFNDEDNGIIRIPLSPFNKFKLPREKKPDYKSISISELRSLINAELTGVKAYSRDAFVVSFLLAGMNPIDLYSCETIKSGRIVYNRAKTKGRRADNALIHILISDQAKIIIERLKPKSGKRIFNFSERYSTNALFRENMRKNLTKIGDDLGIKKLTMYSARHTFASIAQNDIKINKYTIHEALNHSDPSMKVTDTYIRKEWKNIDDAIIRVEDYVFNKKSHL